MLYLEYFWWICVWMILINKLGFSILWTHCECLLSISTIFDGKPVKEMFEYEHFNVLCTSNTLHLLNHHQLGVNVGCICFGTTINRCVLKSQNFLLGHNNAIFAFSNTQGLFFLRQLQVKLNWNSFEHKKNEIKEISHWNITQNREICKQKYYFHNALRKYFYSKELFFMKLTNFLSSSVSGHFFISQKKNPFIPEPSFLFSNFTP